MDVIRIAAVVGLLTVFAACSDEPTNVNETRLSEPQFFNSDNGSWVLLDWGTETDTWWIECANDGQGEELEGAVTYYIWGKVHSTASGNTLMNMKLTFEDEETYFIGLTSGDFWALEKVSNNAQQHTKASDGTTTMWGALMEHYINQDGDKLHLHTNWSFVFDQDFNLISAEERRTCGPPR